MELQVRGAGEGYIPVQKCSKMVLILIGNAPDDVRNDQDCVEFFFSSKMGVTHMNDFKKCKRQPKQVARLCKRSRIFCHQLPISRIRWHSNSLCFPSQLAFVCCWWIRAAHLRCAEGSDCSDSNSDPIVGVVIPGLYDDGRARCCSLWLSEMVRVILLCWRSPPPPTVGLVRSGVLKSGMRHTCGRETDGGVGGGTISHKQTAF